jgi:S-adenosylmethionine/arginine decarboxylase-like enzyme
MKKFGKTVVVNFGEDPRVSGFSMTQLIETSLISGHFANNTNAVYLDVFSCKEYPPHKTAEFCREFFGAKSYKIKVNFRF